MKTKIILSLFIVIFSLFSAYTQETSKILTREGTEEDTSDTTTSEAGGNICSEAAAFCTEGTYNFLAKTGADAESGPNYGCLSSDASPYPHNPTWYYMHIKTAGDIVMALSSYQEIDFIIWGPYDAPTCDPDDLDTLHIIDCNNDRDSEGADNTPEIGSGSSCGGTTAELGKYYMFMIAMNVTNPDSSLMFQLKQTNGTGETDCSILCPLYEDLSVTLGDCYSISKTKSLYDLSSSISIENDRINRIVVEWDGTTIIDSLNSAFNNTFTFDLDSLDSDSLEHSVLVRCEYQDISGNNLSCEKEITYTAREDCSGECIVNAGDDISICGDTLRTHALIDSTDQEHYWTNISSLSISDINDTNAFIHYTAAYPTGKSVTIPLVWTIKNRVGSVCSDTVMVTFNPIPSATFNLDDYVCGTEAAKAIYQKTKNPISKYNWSFSGRELTKNLNDSILISFNTEGYKKVCLSVISDVFCSSDTLCDSTKVKHIPSASFTMSEDALFCDSTSNVDISESVITIEDDSIDANTSIIRWVWDKDIKISDSLSSPTEYTITSSKVGYRNISLYIIQDGCESLPYMDSIKVCSKIKAPNIFTPNGDGFNDVFYVKAKSMSKYHCTIYNRWGKVVYEGTDPEDPWNGKKMNTGSEVSTGSYYYVITAEDVENNQYLLKGTIQLYGNN